MKTGLILNRIARIISDIFLPVTISAFCFIYISIISNNSVPDILLSASISLSPTVFFPIIYFFFKLKNKEISNRDATIKEQRTNPFLIVTLVTLFFSIISFYMEQPRLISYFLSVYITSGIFVILVNLKFKISIHSLTSAGAVGLLFYVDSIYLTLLILVTILVMWSRIRLKVHTISQVFLGSISGFLISYFQLSLLKHFWGF